MELLDNETDTSDNGVHQVPRSEQLLLLQHVFCLVFMFLSYWTANRSAVIGGRFCWRKDKEHHTALLMKITSQLIAPTPTK